METTKYKIFVQGNGLFVTVTRKSDGWDFFLQGDDATEFLTDLDHSIRDEVANDYIEEYADLFTNPTPISGKI